MNWEGMQCFDWVFGYIDGQTLTHTHMHKHSQWLQSPINVALYCQENICNKEEVERVHKVSPYFRTSHGKALLFDPGHPAVHHSPHGESTGSLGSLTCSRISDNCAARSSMQLVVSCQEYSVFCGYTYVRIRSSLTVHVTQMLPLVHRFLMPGATTKAE